MKGGVPLAPLQMPPVFYAFKVNDGDPFIERGIELTRGRFFGGSKCMRLCLCLLIVLKNKLL
jgi:hypothetical protein